MIPCICPVIPKPSVSACSCIASIAGYNPGSILVNIQLCSLGVVSSNSRYHQGPQSFNFHPHFQHPQIDSSVHGRHHTQPYTRVSVHLACLVECQNKQTCADSLPEHIRAVVRSTKKDRGSANVVLTSSFRTQNRGSRLDAISE